MKQCETCEFRVFRDELTCCIVADLAHEFTELRKALPLVGKYVKDYECKNYLEEYKPEKGDENG